MLDEGQIYSDIVKETGASTAKPLAALNKCPIYGINDGYRMVLDRAKGQGITNGQLSFFRLLMTGLPMMSGTVGGRTILSPFFSGADSVPSWCWIWHAVRVR